LLKTKPALIFVLLLSMSLPLVGALLYFGTETQRESVGLIYSLSKILQFSLPVIWLLMTRSAWPRPSWPQRSDLLFGFGVGFAIALAMALIYHFAFAGTNWFIGAGERIHEKLLALHAETPLYFCLLAIFISLFHSLLEEYYWRWFVYGKLRTLMSKPLAALLGAIGFMAHHVVVIHAYLPAQAPWTATAFFSSMVFLGGLLWSWQYEKTGRIYAGWISHAMTDIALMVIGYHLVWP
jgi:membrane protease YdiL (CAAX protease family)